MIADFFTQYGAEVMFCLLLVVLWLGELILTVAASRVFYFEPVPRLVIFAHLMYTVFLVLGSWMVWGYRHG